MPRLARTLRRHHDERQGAAVLAAVPYAPPACLSIPRLGCAPESAHFEKGQPELAEIASALARAGILEASHFDHRDLRSAISFSLKELVAPYEKDWCLLKDQLGASYTVDIGGMGHPHHHEERQAEKVAILFGCDRLREIYFIGDVMARTEREHRGAGVRLMRLIEMGLFASFGGITPLRTLQMCQDFYWWGEVDERHRLYEIRDEMGYLHQRKGSKGRNKKRPKAPGEEQTVAEELPAMTDEQLCREYGLPTMATVREWFPDAWAYNMGWGPFYQDFPGTAANLAPPEPDKQPPFFKRPLRCANGRRIRAAANELSAHLATFYTTMFKPTGFADGGIHHVNDARSLENTTELAAPVLLRWQENDGIPRVYDDYMMDLEQAGECSTELCAAACMNPSDTASCQRAAAKLHLLLKTATLLDRLLSLFVSAKTLAQIFGDGDPRVRA